MIEIKNVTKKYGNYVAVEDISFKVEESSIYGLVGYNGAGKTTLLKTAAGILKPESGEVLFDSQNVYDNGKVRSSLLYVPDEVYFVKGASLQKMGKIYKGYFPNFNSKVFKNMTEAMGLDPKKNIGSFSKGMQRQAEVVFQILFVRISAHKDRDTVRQEFFQTFQHGNAGHPWHPYIAENDLRFIQFQERRLYIPIERGE